MSIRDEIELEGETLSEGDSTYCKCPSCGEGTFSITRTDEGNLLYHCFRASCVSNRGGCIGSSNVHATRVGKPRKQRAIFSHATRRLSDVEQLDLQTRLGWKGHHRLSALPHYCDALDRYAFPIIDTLGDRRGWVLRTWDGRTPKALTYLDSDCPRLSHYAGGERHCRSVVVVEDIPSAVRAAEYHNAVSLQGTACNVTDALEIASMYDHVIWCLDDDAFTQGLRLQREHSFLFKQSDVIRPRCDLKDMPEAELAQLLGV
jgi:hypothetical protein